MSKSPLNPRFLQLEDDSSLKQIHPVPVVYFSSLGHASPTMGLGQVKRFPHSQINLYQKKTEPVLKIFSYDSPPMMPLGGKI